MTNKTALLITLERELQGQPLGIVNTWLYQIFWQIYQKLMLSGFLSSGNLCLFHYLKLFWPHSASTALFLWLHLLINFKHLHQKSLLVQSWELGNFFLSSVTNVRSADPGIVCCFFLLEPPPQAWLNWCLKFEKALGMLGEFGTDFGL